MPGRRPPASSLALRPGLQGVPAVTSRLAAALLLLALAVPGQARADLEATLAGLDARVLDDEQAKQAPRLLSADVRKHLVAADARDGAAWREVHTRADWEKFRDAR